MKNILTSLIVILCFTGAAFGGQSVGFSWEQEDMTDVSGWVLLYGTEQGIYANTVDIPISETTLVDGRRIKTEAISLDAFSGQELTLYFALIARDDADPPNISEKSNEVLLLVDLKAPGAPKNLTLTIIIGGN